MRKAMVFRDNLKQNFEYAGVLHGFSTEYEELRDGVGQYTVAIIENELGDICLEPARCIRLLGYKK